METRGVTETSNGNGMGIAPPTAKTKTKARPAKKTAVKAKPAKAKSAKKAVSKVKVKPSRKVASKSKAKPTKAKGSIYEQTVAFLKRNPKADFGKLAARVKGAMPVLYGRAKLTLGLVKAKPRKLKAPKFSVEASPRGPKADNTIADFGLFVSKLEGRSRKLDQALAQIAAIATAAVAE